MQTSSLSERMEAAILEQVFSDDELENRVRGLLRWKIRFNSIRAMFKNKSPVRTQTNLNELIRQVITITAGSVKSNNIMLDANLTDDAPPLVMADPVQLQQVILNLIMNAVEAISHSGDGARVLQLSRAK